MPTLEELQQEVLDLQDIFDSEGHPLKKFINKIDKAIVPKKPRGRPRKDPNGNEPEDNVVNFTYANEQQKKFIEWKPKSGSGELLFVGGLGAAKTFSLCLVILKYLSVPNTKVLLCRLNLSDLKKSTLKTLLDIEVSKDGSLRPPLLPSGAIKNYNKSEGILYLHNGSELICIGASNEEKIKSINATVCVIEELSELSEDQYIAVSNRARIPCELPNMVYAATNPKNKGNWMYKYFKVNQIPGFREMIQVSTKDNAKNLPDGYIEKLMNLPELKRKQLLDGEFVDTGDMVFYCFDEDKHVQSDLGKQEYDSYLIGQDFGGGAGECGMVLLAQKEGKIFCLREFCKKRTSHSEALKWMEIYREPTKGICVYDSANAALATDMQNKEWKLIKSIKDLEGSFTILNDLFHQNSIIIDSKCSTLISQLQNASRTPLGTISKLADWDVLDAMRYGVCAIHQNQTVEFLPKTKRDAFCAVF